jgi:hypothetical protein
MVGNQRPTRYAADTWFRKLEVIPKPRLRGFRAAVLGPAFDAGLWSVTIHLSPVHGASRGSALAMGIAFANGC